MTATMTSKQAVGQKRSSRSGVVSFDGIRLSDGRFVYPALSNTFENYETIPWLSRNKALWLGGALLLLSLAITRIKIDWSPDDAELDKLAVTVDFGDVVQPFKKKAAKPREQVDEVFGNEFIKDKTPPDPNQEDPRIATAVNAAVGVQLCPSIFRRRFDRNTLQPRAMPVSRVRSYLKS
jgi:hypothetical protein